MARAFDLLWDEWNEEHIARHGVDPEEVEEVAANRPHVVRSRKGRYRLIGQTDAGRFLTVFVAPHGTAGYYVLTARDTTSSERQAFRRR